MIVRDHAPPPPSTSTLLAGDATTSASTLQVAQALLIDRPIAELYARWRDVGGLPRFLSHLERVEPLTDRRTRWVARGPRLGMGEGSVIWESEITTDEPNQHLAWHSLNRPETGADVLAMGAVLFTPALGQRGVVVQVLLRYTPPASWLGTLVGRSSHRTLHRDLVEDVRAFKRLCETGEIPTIEGQPRGTCGSSRPRDQEA